MPERYKATVFCYLPVDVGCDEMAFLLKSKIKGTR
jgi:hypothetical protein